MAPTLERYFSGCEIDSPKISAVPPVGEISPSNMRMVVVLPAPFGPTNPQIVPSGTSKFACETANPESYFLLRSFTDIAREVMWAI